MALIDKIIDYELGELDDLGTLDLFAELVRTGQAWSLQGHYGRTAAHLIEVGAITAEGQISEAVLEELG